MPAPPLPPPGRPPEEEEVGAWVEELKGQGICGERGADELWKLCQVSKGVVVVVEVMVMELSSGAASST